MCIAGPGKHLPLQGLDSGLGTGELWCGPLVSSNLPALGGGNKAPVYLTQREPCPGRKALFFPWVSVLVRLVGDKVQVS